MHTAGTGAHSSSTPSALQAIKLLHMTKVFGKSMRVNKASQDKDSADVGANLFIGNLHTDLDEKVSSGSVCHHIKKLALHGTGAPVMDHQVLLLLAAHRGNVSCA